MTFDPQKALRCVTLVSNMDGLGDFVNGGTFMFLGVLRALYIKQKAPPHPPLHPAHETQPHPLFHQLQGDCTQVGEQLFKPISCTFCHVL